MPRLRPALAPGAELFTVDDLPRLARQPLDFGTPTELRVASIILHEATLDKTPKERGPYYVGVWPPDAPAIKKYTISRLTPDDTTRIIQIEELGDDSGTSDEFIAISQESVGTVVVPKYDVDLLEPTLPLDAIAMQALARRIQDSRPIPCP